MLKQTVTYTDFDGNDCEEDLYFNLTQSELVELQASRNGGLVAHLTSVMEAQNGQIIMDTFKWLIQKTYGQRSADGKRFIKTPELAAEFMQTMAYDAFFMKLMTSGAQGAADFINGVIPKEVSSKLPAPEEMAKQITLHNETPVTNENVPPLQPYVAPEGSFSALAQARLGRPADTEIFHEIVEESATKPDLKALTKGLTSAELRALLLERESD